LAIASIVFILQQQKKPRVKVQVDPMSYSESSGLKIVSVGEEFVQAAVEPGERSDNSWLQYKFSNRPLTADEWDKTRFQHRPYLGYYCWPK